MATAGRSPSTGHFPVHCSLPAHGGVCRRSDVIPVFCAFKCPAPTSDIRPVSQASTITRHSARQRASREWLLEWGGHFPLLMWPLVGPRSHRVGGDHDERETRHLWPGWGGPNRVEGGTGREGHQDTLYIKESIYILKRKKERMGGREGGTLAII